MQLANLKGIKGTEENSLHKPSVALVFHKAI